MTHACIRFLWLGNVAAAERHRERALALAPTEPLRALLRRRLAS
jgi:hypothetical protein